MKHFALLYSKILLIICCFMPVTTYAAVCDDYDEAQKIYVAACACLAAYSDRQGKLAYEYLQQDGWQIKPYIVEEPKADARFLLAKKELLTGQTMYLLAVVGTETIKDVKTDLRVDKVYFAGHTPEEFAENAKRQDMPETVPKVHRGFHQYVQAALTATTEENKGDGPRLLSDLLLADQERKIYLVGHSLGGAVATLGGARLISMGVRPEQIEVITFGAPAVGNKAFAQEFEPVLNLTRIVISGDPVTGILQKLVGGYEQFGRKICWEMPDNMLDNPHRVTDYLDLAIKNYYQKRQQAIKAKVIERLPAESSPKQPLAYVAALKNRLPSDLQAEFGYMEQALQDEYRKALPSYILADEQVDDVIKTALQKGCRWAIVPEISGYRLKNERICYYITFQQVIYDTSTGHVVDIASSSTATYNFTPLEAAIHDVKTMNSNHCFAFMTRASVN